MMATEMKVDLHGDLMKLAESMVAAHIEEYDGEQCFMLGKFTSHLGDNIQILTDSHGLRLLMSGSSCRGVAMYLFSLLAIQDSGSPNPDRFRGYPVMC